MNTEKERVMYKEELKQSLIWHSNLSYDDIGRDQEWNRVWILEVWSENSCGKWYFLVWNSVRILRTGRHTPTRILSSTPRGTYYASSVSKKTLKSVALSPGVIFFLFKKYTQCLRYLTLGGQKFPRHSLYSLSWFIWRGCHLTLLGLTYRIMRPRCQANEFYKNSNGEVRKK